MSSIINLITKVSDKLFEEKKKNESRSFFDFSSEEKKKIINEAADESNKMQSELVREYKKKFPHRSSVSQI